MTLHRVTYKDERPDEFIQADRVTVVESNGQVVLHRDVLVMNRTREIVIRRLAGREITSVEEWEEPA
ncbi:MAG: hypothetical protein JWP14_396 [Frankiales bacterium]|nr:hypothetical protein [Frankiales bacterium]